jgi:formamidopyrimidine-DNA glycosylase
MPEGPEVETIRAGLAANSVGQVIAYVDVLFARTFLADAALIRRAVIGARISQVKRRGKVLIIELDSGWTMLCHLKMTGQIVLMQADGSRLAGGHPSDSMAAQLPDRSTRVVFGMESGEVLYFNDQRKFGWIRLVPDADVLSDSLLGGMGPEVLSPQFSLSYLTGQLKRRSRSPIKAVILDQAVVAGVGNIYADESLHLSRIHPAKLAGSLTEAETKRLYMAVRDIITAGIEHGGTSFSHYVNSLGGKGDYLDFTRVFRRDGQACPVCGTTILKTRVAGRGTHYCPTCQPLVETVAKT